MHFRDKELAINIVFQWQFDKDVEDFIKYRRVWRPLSTWYAQRLMVWSRMSASFGGPTYSNQKWYNDDGILARIESDDRDHEQISCRGSQTL